MTDLTSELLQIYEQRGYIHQCTDLAGLDAHAGQKKVICYIGYDCTADSLHVGSLVSIMMLRWLQKTGHKPIVLMGGGTTRVGDPSGKDAARKLLTDAAIAANMAGIKKIFEQFLVFGDGGSDAVMINNADWLLELNYLDFLREYGRHFSINRMLGFESVKQRLDREQSLSFLEFNYMILRLTMSASCSTAMAACCKWGAPTSGGTS